MRRNTMIQVLIDLLSPVFTGMGVSASDVQQYGEMLSGYVYGILGVLLLVAVVMIAAHWFVRKGARHVARWTAAVAGVLAIAVIVNVVCFGPMYNNLSVVINGSAVKISDESLTKSADVIKVIGEEGIVLVKNDGLLPLKDTESLNVFGWGSTNPVFGGSGSGSSDSSTAIGILQSLQDAGFSTNQSLTDMYTAYSPTRNRTEVGNGVHYSEWTLPEPTIEYYTDELMNEAKNFSTVAMIVIGRTGGEGMDLPMDMNALIKGTYDIRDQVANGNPNYNYFNSVYVNNSETVDDFDPGKSYLQLSNPEEAMIEKVCSEFENVIVVINANNTMELGWVNEYDAIKSVILAPGTGATGMSALGEILNGSVNPSGKTVDTFVYDLTDTPYYNNFGNFAYTNLEDLKASFTQGDAAYEGNIAFVDYVENIYVGYKFYETAAEEGLINYNEKVLYPFGYGLSYTSFTQEIQNFVDNGDTVAFDVNVTNTGNAAGKDVVQVYYTPPYVNGGIEKASVNLIQFGKTKLLDPNASELVHFEIVKEDMASYDSFCLKTRNGGYILEAGTYTISVRSDSHTVLDSVDFQVASDIDYSVTGRTSDLVVANNQFQDYSIGTVEYLSRRDSFANYASATAAPAAAEYIMDDATRAHITEKSTTYYDPTLYDDPNAEMPATGASNGMKLSDMVGASYDDERWDKLLDQATVEEMIALVNLGGFQTIAVESLGKVSTMDCDGPAGLRNWLAGVSGTAFPTAVLIAQTWNVEIAADMGDAVGSEYADTGSWGWYGPAMNTHRSAFCGRNFEYYSEDGVLASYLASAVVSAAADHGVYSYIKHFVLNDQETNRCSFILTFSTEQAIREIYMKPFERCIKNMNYDTQPAAVMSSFNFIGDVYSGSNSQLLNHVLRGEWGFQGMVLTDWNGSYGFQNTDDCIRNGNDIMLGFNSYESNRIIDVDAASCVQALRQATKNIMFTVVHSGAYTAQSEQSGMDNMTRTFVIADVLIAVVALGIEAIVVIRFLKRKKGPAEVNK